MRSLNKYTLEFQPCLNHFKHTLSDANELSDCVLKYVEFEKGQFFTLLPEEADMNRVYQFSEGGILNRGVFTKINFHGKEYNAEIINNIRSEFSNYLIQISVKYNSIIFDCVSFSASDSFECDKIGKFKVCYREEVCFMLNRTDASVSRVHRGLRLTNAFWHSLCILTNFSKAGNESFSENDLQQIAQQATLIAVIAYDSEGYLLWQKE